MNEARHQAGTALLYLCVLLVIFSWLFVLTSTPAAPVTSADELAFFDFDASTALLETACFEWYPNALYSPQDFAAGVSQPPQPLDGQPAQYGTYRLVANLPAGAVFGLSAYSATYSQKLWVGGVLLSQVGTPGSDAETTVHKTSYFTVYFEANAGPTEIVVQRSDFSHSQAGRLYPQYLGLQSRITAMLGDIRLRGGILVGCMLMVALFLLGVFIFFKRQRQFLWFALACVSVMVRTLYTDHKLIALLFPNADWGLSRRVEYLFTAGFFVFFILSLNSMYGWRLPRAVNGSGLVLGGVWLLTALFAPVFIYTAAIPWLQLLGLAYLAMLFVLHLVAKDKNGHGLEQAFILLGGFAFGFFMLVDVIRYRFTSRYDDLNLTQMGMIVFTLANVLALVLNFSRTEQALAQSRHKAEKLARQDEMRAEFLSNISHELKTPLTVISNYAQYTRVQLDDGTFNKDTRQNLLVISLEAQRLALLAEQLLAVPAQPAKSAGVVSVLPGQLLARTAALCRPILQKNGNRLQTGLPPDSPSVLANPDAVMQVLVNLCDNAGRHTRNGQVSVTARPSGGMMVFQIKDDGEGIPPDLLPRVFERGVSGDGKTGLGLAICQAVIETYKGAISIESSPGEGTCVTFTLPVAGAEKGARP